MKIKKRIKRLCKSIQRTTQNINSGGCCVFAAHVAYVLKYRHNIPVSVRVERWYDNDDDMDVPSIDVARTNISDISHSNAFDWVINGIEFSHVIIELTIDEKLYHVDSTGIKPVNPNNTAVHGDIPLYPGSLTVEEALLLCSEQSGWNSEFNRDQIPHIMDLIHTHLS